MKQILAKLAVIGVCSYATIATAQPITFNVDIGAANQQYVGLAVCPTSLPQLPEPANATNWNNMAINGLSSLTIANIKSSLSNTFPGVSITVSNKVAGGGMNTFDTTGNTTPNPLALMRDYSFFQTYIVVVGGLPAGSYDLWFYGHGDQNNQAGTLRIAAPYGAYTNSTANDPLGRDLINGGEGISYLTVSNLTVGTDGLLLFEVVNYMNGFQLRPSQPQGPAFLLTGVNGCSVPGVTPGTSGSVTTNSYMLYRDGAYVGPTVAGTGGALNFGTVTTPGTYTVVATNTTTATSGLMFGSVRVYLPGVSINTQPTSVSVVSNLPASFTVQAAGDALTYQWYKNGVQLNNGGNIFGATTPTLKIAAVQTADAATSLNGYTVVAVNPCSGNGVTSSPPAALTLTAPRDLIWAGGNPGSDWNYTNQEFLLSGSPTNFAEGDKVTFNDSSANTSVTLSNNVTATLVTVSGTTPYTFSGSGKITGVSKLVDNSSGTLTIKTANDFTGGASVGSGATLSLGDGTSGNAGSMSGEVDIAASGTLLYNYYGGTVNILNSLAGSGTNICNSVNGGTLVLSKTAVNSNFTGVVNIKGYTRVQAQDSNGGYAFGNGSTINIEFSDGTGGGQAYLGIGTYSNVFNIQGTGWPGDTARGALRVFGCTVNGQINMLADSRIGGWWNTSTLTTPITGPYELEIFGTYLVGSARFNVQMGPTSPQTYASTKVSSGTLTALNTNAISSGPLTIDTSGELALNGNNLTVARLTSVNTVSGTGAVVDNKASAAAVLTVGTDDNSSQFDGTFSDGGTGSLGLTKVGAGTLTLTANNTNTGPVTVTGGALAMSGSGAFDSASRIIVGSGASYDVTGAGGPLNRSSGKTLGGSGTVIGNVNAGAGSIIAPGSSIGTLTVNGNVVLSSAILNMEVNRTNTPSNCDKLLTSGGSISGSGTLNVTNIGPALQIGNTFTFFGSGVSGITVPASTVDPVNAVTYTWTDNLSGSGSISVASVTLITSPVLTNSVSGNTLTFSWTGPFKLQSQTNSLATGVSTNWSDYPGGGISPVNVIINRTNPTVFFRLKL